MKKDLDLVRICSFLFFDGHIYKTHKCFYFSSNDLKMLEKMAEIVNKKFSLQGKLYINDGGVKKNTHKYRFFSKKICDYLISVGVPVGAKTDQEFLIPKWILNNKEFAREFVKFAYYCEGSMKENRKTPRITFNINKSERLVKNGVKFCNQLRHILVKNNVVTTPVGIHAPKTRADGIAVNMIRFRVITKDNNNFINEIGWIK